MTEKAKAPHFTRLKADLLLFMDKVKGKRRLQRIENLLRILNFERRFALLAREEVASMNDESLSPAMRRQFDEADATERERLIAGWARVFYFRRLAWINYLNGGTEDKPFTSKKKVKAA